MMTRCRFDPETLPHQTFIFEIRNLYCSTDDFDLDRDKHSRFNRQLSAARFPWREHSVERGVLSHIKIVHPLDPLGTCKMAAPFSLDRKLSKGHVIQRQTMRSRPLLPRGPS